MQFQIANSLARRIERADRDQTATCKALEAYEDLLRLYPTSEYAEKARDEIKVVRDHLAEHEFVVGPLLPALRRCPPRAPTRLEGLLEAYPDYRQRDKALYYLGLAYRASEHAGRRAGRRSAAERRSSRESEWTPKIPEANR